MGIFDTFSKRKKKRDNAGVEDVYKYDNFPKEFRVQIVHIWQDAIGPYEGYTDYDFTDKRENNKAWSTILEILTRELGVFKLGSEYSNPKEQCIEFILNAKTDNVLDIIELSFRLIDKYIREMSSHEHQRRGVQQEPDDAIIELNQRFFEHGLGYQYVNGQIIRIDSQLIHEEVVKNALVLIHQHQFRGVDDEFRKAYEHYRHGRNKEALNEALKAFESAAKAICDNKKWKYPSNVTAKGLIEILFKNQLVSSELQSHFTALRSVLESGVPVARNKQSGHGQGIDIKDVDAHLVSFILHSTASAIVFFIQASNE